MYVGDVLLAKAMMAERMEEAERYRRSAATRQLRPTRPRTRWVGGLRQHIHLPHVVRHHPV